MFNGMKAKRVNKFGGQIYEVILVFANFQSKMC